MKQSERYVIALAALLAFLYPRVQAVFDFFFFFKISNFISDFVIVQQLYLSLNWNIPRASASSCFPHTFL